METKLFSGFEAKASRLELLVRIPYGIAVYLLMVVLGFVVGIWGWAIAILQVINWFHILFTATRWKFCNEHTVNFINFAYARLYIDYVYKKVLPYFVLLTDKRPGFSF